MIKIDAGFCASSAPRRPERGDFSEMSPWNPPKSTAVEPSVVVRSRDRGTRKAKSGGLSRV